ncbi:DNA primase [Niameybacter massiliensis]|uniref:DNA primase n=1 Tax=Holtiella tumoricola TaxID=3018743 RepID=A0AA42J1S0_9FIRM|nr:DNA primase [Holtiella tumoricola]MDA3732436.1 DNA primase [Holtiella tumoricola]
MYYSDEIIEKIREQSDIISIISEYTALTRKGSSHVGLCPFHNEKTPSFSVSDDKQMYYCFGCGAGGNVFTFVMQKENMTFPEAVQFLAEKAHIDLDGMEKQYDDGGRANKKALFLEIYKKAARYYYYSLNQRENEHALNYFYQRGISQEVIKHFGLGYAPADYNIFYRMMKQEGYEDEDLVESGLFIKSKSKGVVFDRFSDRVMFPIFNINKKVVAFGGRILGEGQPKYLNSPESLLFDKSRTLYGLHIARQEKHPYYILVEGYMDVIAMHVAGFTQTVASLGTAFTEGHARLLKRHTEQVVILYDSDGAGKKAALRAIPILRSQGIQVKVLQLEDSKDPDEFLKKHGADEMRKLLEEAESHVWFRIKEIESQYHLDLPDERVKFLQEIAKLLGNLESSIEQNIYTKEIAMKYQVSLDALEAEIKKYFVAKQNIPVKQAPQVKEQLGTGTIPMQLEFLCAVYNYPNIYSYIASYIEADLFEEGLIRELAAALLKARSEGREVDASYFNNRYTDVKEQKIISTVFMKKDARYEDEDLMHKMLVETIKRLNSNYIEKRLKTTADIQEVQALLIKKRGIDKLHIDFING